MTGKFVFLLTLLVAIAGIASGDGTRSTHDLIVGAHTPYDNLVVRQRVEKYSGWPFMIVELQKTLNENSIITQVRALDQYTNGKGAYASLLGGGPGANNVTLYFKSQRNNGIDFIVELWAE